MWLCPKLALSRPFIPAAAASPNFSHLTAITGDRDACMSTKSSGVDFTTRLAKRSSLYLLITAALADFAFCVDGAPYCEEPNWRPGIQSSHAFSIRTRHERVVWRVWFDDFERRARKVIYTPG